MGMPNSAAQGFWTNASPPMVSEARDIPRIDNNAYKKHSNRGKMTVHPDYTEHSEIAKPGSFNQFKLPISITAISLVLILIIVSFLVLNGGGSAEPENSDEWIALENRGDFYDAFLATIDADQVVTSTRLGSGLGTFNYFENLNDVYGSELSLVSIDGLIYTWGEQGSDKELRQIDKDSGISTVIYSGKDILSVTYIAEKKTFIIDDDGSCYAQQIGTPQIRLGVGRCYFRSGRLFIIDSEQSDSTLIVEVDLSGSSLNRFSFPLDSPMIRNQGRLVTGLNQDGTFEVYSLKNGNRIWSSAQDELVTVLSESKSSENLLLSIENSKLDDETLDIGVLVSAEGGATFKRSDSPFSGEGLLSSDGGTYFLITKPTQESDSYQIIQRNIMNDVSEIILNSVNEVLSVESDRQGRVVILTDRDLIVGSFDDGFEQKISGSFTSGSFYSSKVSNGLIAFLRTDGETGQGDLVFVNDGLATDGSRRYLMLASNIKRPLIDPSSMAESGYLVFGETDDDYMQIFRQELKDNSARSKIAEGRLDGFQWTDSQDLYYFEEDKDLVNMYYQRGIDPTTRKTISTRYIVSLNSADSESKLRSLDYVRTGQIQALVDEDLKTCRSFEYPILTIGDSGQFELTRELPTENMPSDNKYFCVQTDGSARVRVPFVSWNAEHRYNYVQMQCTDYESDFIDEVSEDLNRATPEISLENGIFKCYVHDDVWYREEWNGDSWSMPIMGGIATVEISE